MRFSPRMGYSRFEGGRDSLSCRVNVAEQEREGKQQTCSRYKMSGAGRNICRMRVHPDFGC